SRAEIARAWGGPPLPGEKAVANFDEDSLTMAVAACRDCLRGFDKNSIDALYFASTSFPYLEKQSAAVVATALDTAQSTFTTDVSNSLKGGVSAVRLAVDAIGAGSTKSVLVCAADVRLGLPGGAREMEFGDGAAALLLGDKDVIATIDGSHSVHNEIIDVFRSSGDTFVRSWEDRFVREKGYGKVVPETVAAALKKYGLAAKDFAKLVVNIPNRSALASLAKGLGFDPKTQVQDPLADSVGNTGCALPLMLLVAALEEAKPGDRLLWASYGDGCDVYILTVTEAIKNVGARGGISKHLASRRLLPTYEKYLRWRNIVITEPQPRPPMEVPSAVALWRDSRGGLALCGVRCENCGTPQYPAQRVCMICRTKDRFSDYCFADRVGRVTTFSQDSLAASVDPPSTVCAVDFDGGGRIMCDMIDRDPQQVEVGMPVVMAFRHLRHISGIHDYWWKCQPPRY
ncbi:MAG: OB-fold domain-containing protein, partial [Chloroflexota bacterium]